MCGGSRATFEQVRPLFAAIAANVFHVGPVGAGHTIKLINNYLGQVSVAAISEMLPLAARCGVDPAALFDVVSVSGGNSRVFQGLVPRLQRRDFAVHFRQKYVYKDLRYINGLAQEEQCPVRLAPALLALHAEALAQGYGEEDFSALLKFWEAMGNAGRDRHAETVEQKETLKMPPEPSGGGGAE